MDKNQSKVRSAKTRVVIEVISIIGDGTNRNPVRQLKEYYDSDGKLLASHDTIND